MMPYNQALRLWGAQRIQQHYQLKSAPEPASVRVEMEFNEGFACCGGRDPDCYCSFAESPSASVVITGGGRYRVEIDHDEFDFAQILGEIVDAAGGAIGA